MLSCPLDFTSIHLLHSCPSIFPSWFSIYPTISLLPSVSLAPSLCLQSLDPYPLPSVSPSLSLLLFFSLASSLLTSVFGRFRINHQVGPWPLALSSFCCQDCTGRIRTLTDCYHLCIHGVSPLWNWDPFCTPGFRVGCPLSSKKCH